MDRRDMIGTYGAPFPPHEFDERNMTLTVKLSDGEVESEYVFPCIYQVCETCDGKGRHVNPSIDAHGITPEEFIEDPDFERDYLSGVYDVCCAECGGKRVVPQVNRETSDKKALDLLDAWVEDEINYIRTCEAERRMGA